eukprot:592193_1
MVIEAILKLKDPTKKQIVVYLEKNHELSGSKMTADVSSILKKGKKDGSICSGSTSHRYKLCSGSKDQQSSKVSKAETNHKKKKPTKKDKTKPPPQPKYEWIPAVSPWDCCGEHPDVLKREDTLAVSKILATQMESIAVRLLLVCAIFIVVSMDAMFVCLYTYFFKRYLMSVVSMHAMCVRIVVVSFVLHFFIFYLFFNDI